MGCGVTSEVATTHPSSGATASVAIGPTPMSDPAPGDGRPRAQRPGASPMPAARVATRPPAEVVPAATRSTAIAEAEASAIALGSPTRRIQSGRVVDEAGQPLIGATVLLKGTTRGTSTDANGDYSLPVPLGTNTFVFAYSGYEQETAQSRDGQPILVTLLPAADHTASAEERPSKPHARKRH
jgi:hypothetical protein